MSNSSLTIPTFHSLGKAANELNRLPEELIQAAAEGAMEVIFGLPPDHACKIIKLGMHSQDVMSERASRIVPIFFALNPSQCFNLMTSGLALVDVAKVGYLYSKDRDFTLVSPEQADTYLDSNDVPLDKSPSHSNQFWAFFKDGEMIKCRVTKDMTWIRIGEIAKFTESLKVKLFRHKPENFPADIQPQSVLRQHESEKLDFMNLAASKFWFQKAIIRDDNATHPYTEDIEDWFVHNGFSPTAAGHATSLIRPEFGGTGRRRNADSEPRKPKGSKPAAGSQKKNKKN